MNQILIELVRPPLVTYSSLCSICVTSGTPWHSIGHQLLRTTLYHECYGFEREFFTLRRFLPSTPSCWFQGFPGSRQFNIKVSRASCWSSRHSPGPTIRLNHNNPQKRYGGRFYLRVTAGRLRNKESASYWIWTRFAKGGYVKNRKLYPFGHRVVHSVIN